MKFAVIGGTDPIGPKVAEKLMRQGHEVLVAASITGLAPVTDEDLHDVLDGADVVIDLFNSPAFEERVAVDCFRASGGNLAVAEVAAGVRHHVSLAVAGSERSRESFDFHARLAWEHLIKSSPVPYTLIRASRCSESVQAIAKGSTKGDTVRLPLAFFRRLAAEDVATAVADAALAGPVNGTIEIAWTDTVTVDEPVREVAEYDNGTGEVIADPRASCSGLSMGGEIFVSRTGAG
jgi:uncharacterized protein YbjT (DUF2867 family)